MSRLNKIFFLFVVGLAFFYRLMFVVYETDKAIVLRFKKILTDENNQAKIYNPGLHFKIPFIDELKRFDARLVITNIKESRITTSEKKDVLVDYFIQWKITDFALYYKRTQGMRRLSENLIKEKVNAILKIEFGQLTIQEVVSGERSELMDRLRRMANESSANMGIDILDVRVKQVNLPTEVSYSVYNRMRAERERKANEFRAEGEKEAIAIRAKADKQQVLIIADAEKQAKILKGQGDALAAKIFAQAYNKSPEFYRFYRSLEAYQQSFDGNDILVLKPDNDFFKYFGGLKD